MRVLLTSVMLCISSAMFSQVKSTELFDLFKKIIPDSSEYEVVGDWAVNKPGAFPVKWQNSKIEMSPDEKINFYRKGTALITIKGKSYGSWPVMLMGARSGYSSFIISSAPGISFRPKIPIDSLFGKNDYTYKLIKKCDNIADRGFYYYRLQLKNKEVAWLKLSWLCAGNNCAVKLECFDDWMKQYADINCR